MKLAKILIVLASAAHLIGYINASSDHILDATWPLHARFHTLQAVIWLGALDGIAIAVALGPYVRTRWGRHVLAGSGLVAHGAYFGCLAVFPTGGPPEMFAHVSLALLLVVYAAGVALLYRSA